MDSQPKQSKADPEVEESVKQKGLSREAWAAVSASAVALMGVLSQLLRQSFLTCRWINPCRPLPYDRCFYTPIGCTGFPGWEDSSNNSRCDRQPLDRPSANLVWGSLHNQCRDSACLPVRQKMWHHQCAPSTLLR